MLDSLETRPRSRFAALAQRHPVALFLMLAVAASYALSLIPILMQFGVIPGRLIPARLGIDMERATGVLLLLALFPTAVAVTWLEGGRPAVQQLFRRMLRWQVPLMWWLVAVVALPALTVIIAVILGDLSSLPTRTALAREILGVAAALLIVNLWEEAVWAGFLQTRLERRYSFFVAAALTAVPFAAVHLPLRVVTGEVRSASDLAVNFGLLLVLGLIVRPLFGMVLRGARNSLLLVALTHTFFNRSNNSDGIAADILSGDNRPIAALLATLILTVLLGVVLRKKLTGSYRRELDDAEH
jgi:membrane protease YdiL (CAAX protease family)